jgi:hypothetical protein
MKSAFQGYGLIVVSNTACGTDHQQAVRSDLKFPKPALCILSNAELDSAGLVSLSNHINGARGRQPPLLDPWLNALGDSGNPLGSRLASGLPACAWTGTTSANPLQRDHFASHAASINALIQKAATFAAALFPSH